MYKYDGSIYIGYIVSKIQQVIVNRLLLNRLLFWEGSGRDQIGLQIVQSLNIRVYRNIEEIFVFTVNEWQTIGEEGEDAGWGEAELARYYHNY